MEVEGDNSSFFRGEDDTNGRYQKSGKSKSVENYGSSRYTVSQAEKAYQNQGSKLP
jgi:hypothetical protein